MTPEFRYEAIILGLTNVDLDPKQRENVWLIPREISQVESAAETPETRGKRKLTAYMRTPAFTAI